MTNLPTDPRSGARRGRPPGGSPKPHAGPAASELTPEQDPNRWEFLVTIAPLRIPNGTGSPVNPIAMF